MVTASSKSSMMETVLVNSKVTQVPSHPREHGALSPDFPYHKPHYPEAAKLMDSSSWDQPSRLPAKVRQTWVKPSRTWLSASWALLTEPWLNVCVKSHGYCSKSLSFRRVCYVATCRESQNLEGALKISRWNTLFAICFRGNRSRLVKCPRSLVSNWVKTKKQVLGLPGLFFQRAHLGFITSHLHIFILLLWELKE